MTDQTSDHDAEASSGRPAGEPARSGSSDLVASGGFSNEFGDDFRPEDFGGPKDITLRRLSTHSSWDGTFGGRHPLNDAAAPATAGPRRPLSLAAMIAIAALVGAVSGGAATLSLTHFMKDDHATLAAASAAAAAAAAERDKAIDGALAKVNSELASLKNGVETSNKASSARLAKLGEALDKLKTPPAPEKKSSGFLRLAVRQPRVYRLSLLFISIYGVPMILGAWMIEYLSGEGDVSKTLAGLASFLLFGLSAVMRFGGAELREKGWTHKVLCGTLGLAAAGLAAIAVDPVAGAAFLAAVLLATGFGLPYATALTEAQDLYPEEPAEPLALMTLIALLLPIIVIPLVGHAISRDAGDLAFGALAFFLVVATLLNLRRSGYPLSSS